MDMAAINLPAGIAHRVTDGLETACTAALAQAQSETQIWCVYIGASLVLATIDPNVLTDTDIGDDR
jgi:hypothetical protein